MDYDWMEMHLVDDDDPKERALCGDETSAVERRSVRGYLEDKRHGHEVGAVCAKCMDRAAPFAKALSIDLELDGEVDEAAAYCRLADSLARRYRRRDRIGDRDGP